jgi:hypothetical protein
MFETPKEIKPTASLGLWISIAVVVVLAAAGGYFLSQYKSSVNKEASATAGATAQAKADADPVRDLQIQRATMGKDRLGTMTVWSITIENKSTGFTYSNIKYQTTYIGADDRVLMQSQGTIADSYGPGQEKSIQVNDPLYPAGTVRYRMKITGATPAAR